MLINVVTIGHQNPQVWDKPTGSSKPAGLSKSGDLGKSDDLYQSEMHRTAALATMASLAKVASPAELTYLSNRPPEEVEALQQEVAAVIPAGNIVGLVMGGLMRLKGRTLPQNQAKSDISSLLRGIENPAG